MATQSPFRFGPELAPVLERCWKNAAAPPEWNLTRQQFEDALARSAARRFAACSPDPETVAAYFEGLHLGDLAMACACAAGNVAAWERFVAQYRPELHRAARAIAGESAGPELADSLFAELFGLREHEGQRESLFQFFHGRSRMGAWLRAILAQRHVDELRRTRRLEPFEEWDTKEGAQAAENAAPDPERDAYVGLLQGAVAAALGALDPRDRLRLAFYYVEDLTLSQIGGVLGEHEATVSRKLERTRKELRRRVEDALREEKKLSEAQVRLCYEYAQEKWPFDLTRALSARD